MWKQHTDLESVKKVCLTFLHMPLRETEFGKAIAVHPIFDSFYQMDESGDGEQRIFDMSEDHDACARLILRCEKKINSAKCCDDIINIIRPPYRLVALKYMKRYMSLGDFSKAFGDVWVESENPNGDINVPPNESAKYFKQADKRKLMNDAEYEYYANLPERMTIYRGVSVGRVKNGLSWTADEKIAVWFANRFNNNGKRGYLLKADILKENVLAYFCRRGEEELVVYPKDIEQIERIELK